MPPRRPRLLLQPEAGPDEAPEPAPRPQGAWVVIHPVLKGAATLQAPRAWLLLAPYLCSLPRASYLPSLPCRPAGRGGSGGQAGPGLRRHHAARRRRPRRHGCLLLWRRLQGPAAQAAPRQRVAHSSGNIAAAAGEGSRRCCRCGQPHRLGGRPGASPPPGIRFRSRLASLWRHAGTRGGGGQWRCRPRARQRRPCGWRAGGRPRWQARRSHGLSAGRLLV